MTARDGAAPQSPRVVLVTGGAGFIGSAVVRQLIRDTSAVVVNVDKLTYAGSLEAVAEVSADPRHHFARSDIADASAMRALFERFRPDAVVHLAAETHVDRSIDGPAEFIRTNIVGTYTLLETARAYWLRLDAVDRARFRFVHVSTDEVFGSQGRQGAFAEDAPYRPSSPYAASKASADHLVRSWHRTYGLPTLITNSSNNYGPYQFPEKLIPLITLRALAGGSLPVYGRGENVRDWLFVEDHAAALLAVLSRGAIGATYNIAGGSQRRNLDLVHAICDLVDELCGPLASGPRRTLVTFVADRPGHDLRYAIDDSRIRRELGWAPRESLESGLRRTVRWYAEHPEWGRRARAGGYDGERLGLGEAP